MSLRLEERGTGPEPPFEEVRNELRRAWLRERSEQSLERFTEGLRERAEIEVLDPELAAP